MNAPLNEASTAAAINARPAGAEVAQSILWIDDDTATRQIYAEILQTSGYRVDFAESGSSGWEALRFGGYDLLIIDNDLPKRTGLKLMARLRSTGKTLPLILTTRFCSIDDAQRLPGLPAATTLRKPFTPAELLESIRDLLRATSGRHREDLFFPLLAEVLSRIEPVSHWGINE